MRKEGREEERSVFNFLVLYPEVPNHHNVNKIYYGEIPSC